MARLSNLFVAGLFFLAPFYVSADSPAIAIIIDDIGNNLSAGQRVVNSDWQLACSILPARPYSIELAKLAHRNGKEIMVHLPMQASNTQPLGHGALTAGMNKQAFAHTVNTSIDSIPYASGINNHMGSLLTQHESHMDLLMQTIANRDDYLYFIDSKTTASTIASHVASEYHIPTLMRDVFLDTESHEKEFVRSQVKRLVNIAKQKGYALAIGHPYNSTMDVLDEELLKLSKENIKLVTVSELIKISRAIQWQAYSSL